MQEHSSEEGYQPPYQSKPHIFIFLAGVFLPVVSITLEATTHICANEFFDPIPTVWHLLLVVFVPLAQLQGWFAIRRGDADRLMLASFANPVVIGISLFYSVVYLPLVPVAALLLIAGVGFLPLTPLFSLIAAALFLRRRLRRIAGPKKNFALKTSGLLAGLALTGAVIGVIELPATLTRIGLQKAVAASPELRGEGIRFLRKYGDKEFLLRSCYNRSGWATDLLGYTFSIKNPVTTTEAQQIYYRVTGETFDASIPPERVAGHLRSQDTFDFDSDQGGARVGGKLKGLSLASSKLDGSVDADGGVGYMEWTLVFQNDSDSQREARAEVQLPPGGVVSRLTLWVNGEEREAAFAGNSQVRGAYQQVAIRQRRDPVLVTTAGRDRVLVQCFPVQPQAEMKIRVGITVPLVLEDVEHVRLILPHFVNRNFHIHDDVNHSVWIESKKPMAMGNNALSSEFAPGQAFALRGVLHDSALSDPQSSIELERSNATEMWSKDPFDPGFVVVQSVADYTPAQLRRIVIVVDTSESMRDWSSSVQNAIKSLPSDFDVKLVLADSDATNERAAAKYLLESRPEEVSALLTYASFAGGADNEPALLRAWDVAEAKPGNNAIVWIHSPQRLAFDSVDELRHRWERRPYGPTLYSVQTTIGADEIEKKLDGINEVKSVARTSDLQKDLELLFARLTGHAQTLEYVRSSKKLDAQLNLSEVGQTSDHLARLWANDEVTRILAPRNASLNNAAILLATRYQIVTPVSGAVVLESEAQYRAAELKPVDPGTVPTIPEPEIVALLLLAGVFMIGLAYIKYRHAGRGSCVV